MKKPVPSKAIAVRIVDPEKGHLGITAMTIDAQNWVDVEARDFGRLIRDKENHPREFLLMCYPNFSNLSDIIEYIEDGGQWRN